MALATPRPVATRPPEEGARQRGEVVRAVLLPFFLHRALLVGAATFLSQFIPQSHLFHTGSIRLFDMWFRWDAIHYLRIAAYGYGEGSESFFPLYPLLSALVGQVVGLHIGALLISNLLALCALYLLHGWVRERYGAAVAARAVIVYLLFPTSFFLSAPYAESTYLACCVGVFCSAQRRPALAFMLVFAACLARPQGFVCTTIPFGLAWLIQSRRIGAFPWFTLACFPALLALLAVHRGYTGDPWGFLHAEGVQNLRAFWDGQAPAPAWWEVLWDDGMGQNLMRRLLNWSALGFAAVGSAWLIRERAAEEVSVVVLTFALPLFLQGGLFDAASMARYAILAFPLLVLLARWTTGNNAARYVDWGLGMLQVVLFSLFTSSLWAE